ncbi:MAG: sugar transferase, partial [Christensenellaceae bacterium]|nr:sugar transferase [Christensenellaceae bacterium]
IKIYDNGPVFFKQARVTLNGEIFNIIKFRTMASNIDLKRGSSISVQENDDRITKPGAFLRKTRIDELPQLFNILSGKMSLVGPRPEMLSNVKKYTDEIPEFVYRQRVKCGLTGLAQIDGKYNTTAKDKLLLDLFYIENFSILSDIKLIFRTLTVFFKNDSTEAFSSNKVETPKLRKLSITNGKKAK